MRLLIILLGVLTLSLSACGKKGDLVPPPAYPDEEPEQGQILDDTSDNHGDVNHA